MYQPDVRLWKNLNVTIIILYGGSMRTLMGMERDKIKYWKNNLFFIHNAIPSSMLHFQFIHIYNNKSNLPKVMKAKNEYQIWMLISGLWRPHLTQLHFIFESLLPMSKILNEWFWNLINHQPCKMYPICYPMFSCDDLWVIVMHNVLFA